MRTRSLEGDERVLVSPDDEPVAGVGNVALSAARPLASEVGHVVPTAKLFEGLRRVLGDQVDERLERSES